jgi:uncharacterized coiled-coil protein SlyX
MAQIIKHRRGSLEKLSEVTGSLQKGEIVLATGSANLTTTNGTALSFIVPESGSVQATNRFLMGSSNPNIFSASTYNGMLKGVPYYASGSSTLFLLGSDGNEAINLVGNIQPFSGSVNTRLSDVEAAIGGAGSGISTRVTALEALTGSYATTGSNQFNGDQTITGSLLVTGPIQGTGSIFLQPDVTDSRKLEIYNTSVSDVHIKATGGQTFLGDDTNFVEINDSLQTINITAANGVFVTGIEETIGEFSQSVDSRFSASVASVTSLSASVASVTGDFSSSVATSFSASAYNVSASNASQDIRIDQLASFTGSYATTGSNIFFGTQTFTGSVYITQDLIVQGSSSLQNVTASAVSIGTNQINLNTDFPAFRYAGLNVYDSGSSGVSASLQWDSLTDQWIFVHKESGSATVDSSILLYGPLSTGGLGSETGLTSNYLTKVEDNGHGHHLTTSSIEDTGTKVTVHNSLDVTGEISASTINGIGNVTAYSQSVSASLAEITANVGSGVGVSITNLNSFSSSTLGRLDNIESFSSSVETKLTEIGVVSGSLIASASTAKTTNDTQDGRLTNLEATSASVNTSVSNLNSTTASLNTSVSALNSSSASQQISIDALNTFSGSTLGRLTNLESTSASVNTSVSALNSSSASQQISIDALNTVSGSNLDRLSNLELTSASVNTSVSALNSSTASQQISIDALNVVSASNLGRLSNLELTSASVNTSITNINSFTSSVDTKMTEIGVVSGSLISSASAASISIAALNAYTSSNTSTTALNNFTASAETRFTEIGVVSGSLIASASTAKTTNDTQDGRLTNLESTSASVNTSITSLNSFSSSQLTQNSTLATYTGSVETRLTEIGVVSGSLISSASAAKSTNDTQDGRLTNIESTTASLNISVTNINSFTSSASGRLTNLESTSASVNISISALNSSSASQQISIDALNVVSGSNLDRLSQLETASGSAKVAISELNNYTSSLKTAFALSGQNVEVLGDFTVRGSSTIVDSTTIQLGDNIIELNGSGVANGGLLVKDPTAPSTASGSLLWDSTNDYWKGGTLGNESKLLRAGGDNVVTESAQILLTQVNGYETFSGSIVTSFSASNASITSLSASVASVTGDFSSSVATSFSASNASITALSASVASVTGDFSSSVATSFSASAASLTSLSSSINVSFSSSQAVQDSRLGLLEISTGSLNLFTSSIDTTIKTKLDAETVVSGSSQIDITSTTGFSTFSASIETRISIIDGGTY